MKNIILHSLLRVWTESEVALGRLELKVRALSCMGKASLPCSHRQRRQQPQSWPGFHFRYNHKINRVCFCRDSSLFTNRRYGVLHEVLKEPRDYFKIKEDFFFIVINSILRFWRHLQDFMPFYQCNNRRWVLLFKANSCQPKYKWVRPMSLRALWLITLQKPVWSSFNSLALWISLLKKYFTEWH